MQEFRDVIRYDDDVIGRTDLVDVDIVLETETPVHARPRDPFRSI